MRYLLLFLFLSITLTASAQSWQFKGTWTKVHTTYAFDFELTLKSLGSDQVSGYFVWKVVHYDEHNPISRMYYESKIGLEATEYIQGTYNATEKTFYLKGYKKDDPYSIIALDTYVLEVDDYGNIGGKTDSNGSGLGRITGQPATQEFL